MHTNSLVHHPEQMYDLIQLQQKCGSHLIEELCRSPPRHLFAPPFRTFQMTFQHEFGRLRSMRPHLVQQYQGHGLLSLLAVELPQNHQLSQWQPNLSQMVQFHQYT
uniref:Uncharacterized protein n=1 Tax=Opuntia streptacantha TaxID=393608 RepID=A0A7C9CF29_OPUST